MHLFAFGGGRPYGNKQMRNMFGPMVDSPSPREYIHVKTPPEITFSVVESMKTGTDLIVDVQFRTMKKGVPPGMLFIKHLRSYKNPTQVKYS